MPKGRIQNRRLGNSEQDCRFRIDYKIVDRGVREVPAGARLRAAVRLFCVVCEVKPCKCLELSSSELGVPTLVGRVVGGSRKGWKNCALGGSRV